VDSLRAAQTMDSGAIPSKQEKLQVISQKSGQGVKLTTHLH
jgi:hypothetical protein